MMLLYCDTHGIDLEVDGSTRWISLPAMGVGTAVKTLCALVLNPDVEATPELLQQGRAQVRVRDLDGQLTNRTCEVEVR